jgi:FtsP/CotA-like multicopper oxidase with cupredoxin domain
VTQNAVEPGGRYVYRFRPEQVGTFWYHTHQDASQGVNQGLFGALVIEPPVKHRGLDLALPVHTFAGHTAIGTHDDVERRAVKAGMPVRLRLINTDSASAKFQLSGMLASVVAIDGAEIAPARVPPGEPIELGAGGRYDIAFRMPDGVASVEVENSKAALVLSPDGIGNPTAAPSGPTFDPAARARTTPVTRAIRPTWASNSNDGGMGSSAQTAHFVWRILEKRGTQRTSDSRPPDTWSSTES